MKMINVKKVKQGGFVIATELVLIVSILVLGLVIGLTTIRDSVNAEMQDVASAVGALDQTYVIMGITNPETTAAVAGSTFDDAVDTEAGDNGQFAYVAGVGGEAGVTAGGTAVAAVDAAFAAGTATAQ